MHLNDITVMNTVFLLNFIASCHVGLWVFFNIDQGNGLSPDGTNIAKSNVEFYTYLALPWE